MERELVVLVIGVVVSVVLVLSSFYDGPGGDE